MKDQIRLEEEEAEKPLLKDQYREDELELSKKAFKTFAKTYTNETEVDENIEK